MKQQSFAYIAHFLYLIAFLHGASFINTVHSQIYAYANNPGIYTVGQAITINTPVLETQNSLTSVTSSPSLPLGLSFNGTGHISGTPTNAAASRVYMIRSVVSNVPYYTPLWITVNDATVVSNLQVTYSITSVQFNKGSTVTSSSFPAPTIVGTVQNAAIYPPLPTGLMFNASSGMIYGNPTIRSDKTYYKVTFVGVSQNVDVTLQISVFDSTYPTNENLSSDIKRVEEDAKAALSLGSTITAVGFIAAIISCVIFIYFKRALSQRYQISQDDIQRLSDEISTRSFAKLQESKALLDGSATEKEVREVLDKQPKNYARNFSQANDKYAAATSNSYIALPSRTSTNNTEGNRNNPTTKTNDSNTNNDKNMNNNITSNNSNSDNPAKANSQNNNNNNISSNNKDASTNDNTVTTATAPASPVPLPPGAEATMKLLQQLKLKPEHATALLREGFFPAQLRHLNEKEWKDFVPHPATREALKKHIQNEM